MSVCMHAKLFQSCPTPCDPMDCSPPGSSVQWVPEGNCLTSPNLGCLICKMEIIMITIIIRIRIITYIKYVAYDRPKTVHFFSFSFSFSQFSSVAQLCPTLCNPMQHIRPPCPSPTPRVYPNSCPSSWWCHPAISSSVVPFSSCPQSLPASGSFPMSQLFSWGGQSTGVSASASFPPKKSQDWSPSEWTGWNSMQSKGLSSIFSNTTVQKVDI